MIRRTALVVSGVSAIVAAIIYQPPADLMADSSAESARNAVPIVEAGMASRGASGEVKMKFVRAGERVAYPLNVHGSTIGFTYKWVKIGSDVSGDVARPLDGDILTRRSKRVSMTWCSRATAFRSA